ncbi:helix-turn-helix domain-containing protein [Lactiplantibacillus plantarum]|uniref:helix-turn-helix domain-containing protein n=2 Tax=Lactiplantibacillus plantarum TaxID=1590 RepID=UPI00082522D1|nr:helix-turn-helix domain-containing protein [Lactiplantibacillus plantarum]
MGPKEAKYTLEEKLFYICLVQDGQPAKSIRRQYGVHDSKIQQCLERYEADGVNGLKKRRVNQTYSQKFNFERQNKKIDYKILYSSHQVITSLRIFLERKNDEETYYVTSVLHLSDRMYCFVNASRLPIRKKSN